MWTEKFHTRVDILVLISWFFSFLQTSVNQAVPITANSMPGSSAAMEMGGLPGGQKHGGNAYDNADRDGYYKRPRVEAYANALTSDIDSYRKLHEVSALVSLLSWILNL